MRAKKGQEEIMGFVVIVVVMTIVLVVFLTFLSKPSVNTSNEKEIENFLDSIVLYTTSCEQDTGFLGLKELIIACNNNEQCLDGRSCDILEASVNDILEKTIQVGPEERIKGQNVDIFYRFKDSTEVLIKLKRGICVNNNSIIATENVYPAEQGVVGLKIQECY